MAIGLPVTAQNIDVVPFTCQAKFQRSLCKLKLTYLTFKFETPTVIFMFGYRLLGSSWCILPPCRSYELLLLPFDRKHCLL